MRRNYSKKRDIIYNAFVNTNEHPSAKTVYEKLKPNYPDLSLGTVYRNISVFKSEGKLNTVCTIDGEERLDGNISPHMHLICKACGKIEDVPLSKLCAEENYPQEHGFKVENVNLAFFGKCKDCR
ncbi:MAG: transcriptional repressor [Acutalibacteraceae bacterium]